MSVKQQTGCRKKYLAVCAHPDDMEVRMGGTLIKLARAGHKVKIISLTNGNAGHYEMAPEALATLRKQEAAAAAEFAGLTAYEIWDIPDGHLEVNLHTRERLLKEIREFEPDVLFSFRPWDYHPDHRAAAQLAQDASYLVTVPMYLPQYPAPEKAPVILLTFDAFRSPCAFNPSVAVRVDDTADEKAELLACHESQFFDWLAYDRGLMDEVPAGRKERLVWLKETWMAGNREQAASFRELLRKRYGEAAGSCVYAETFELSEYGRIPGREELNRLLPL
jgi:N-acetylglucosamine malate deacetylase 1